VSLLQSLEERPVVPLNGPVLARLGGPGAVLLAGPAAGEGPEPFHGMLDRLGPTPPAMSSDILSAIWASELQGRGGGSFPLWRKLQAALDAPGTPVVVINCSESEPASRKDWTLCSYRPHVVLEGAAAVARAVGAEEVVIHLHGRSIEPTTAIRCALHQRGSLAGDPDWRLSSGPGGYVAGEASAVARFVHSGVALPLSNSVPLARRGPSGRPTVVTNAETAAHVAALLRMGPDRWRAAGTESCPGPQLLTMAGAVPEPGLVVELVGQATIGEVLEAAGVPAPPAAVLVGGYAGTWLQGQAAWNAPMDATALRRLGAARGCGLIGVLPHGACGLVETGRLTRYMARESAGQCGPCVHGLPVLATCMDGLAGGTAGRRSLKRLHRTADALPGSGACSHPDGVVRLVLSALKVFEHDVVRHCAGKPCRAADHPPVFLTSGPGGGELP
jgi:NADH:ubiquinone oxidoreductase subunit F (NADH-binding)